MFSAAIVGRARQGTFKPGFPTVDNITGESLMPVQMICPSLRCRKILAVPEEVRGKLVKCQHCQTMFRVPEARKQAVGAGSGAITSDK